MNTKKENVLTEEMVAKYFELNQQKKDIENKMEEYKKAFHLYFDTNVGLLTKGQVKIGNYKLQRMIRKTEKYDEEQTVKRLEDLNFSDLIQIVKRPDEEKIKSAIQLGLLKENDLEECLKVYSSPAISVKLDK
ncbi:hypothetical protein [Bacillus sp. FJAT-49736]|uniref:hypothetical protein n=1 Tax=Bacillus sp. FJAT-49736 TaxID=2833582 RepID=UPI001BC97A28|nr:hypothetical protein [Bacillus sp. FJAT-49736]MBS4173914.1 hypothetical protein [Bacillus sp. FJAT-49736]